MRYKQIWLLILIISVGIAPCFSENLKDTVTVSDLSDEFLVFDRSYNTFVPANGEKSTSLHLYRDFEREKEYFLKFKAKPGLTLFANYQLIYQNPSSVETEVFLPVSHINKVSQGPKLVTFFHPEQSLPSTLELGFLKDPSADPFTGISFNVRKDSEKSVLFVLFLVIISLFAYLKNKYYKRLLNFIGIGKGGSEENINQIDFFSSSSVFLIFLNSVAITYIYTILRSTIEVDFDIDYNLLGYVFVVFLIFYIKYLFLQMVGTIFKLGNFSKIHFAEILRVTYVLNLIFVPFLTILYFSELINFSVSYVTLVSIAAVVLIFVLFKLILLTFRVPDFKYVYLFSYLCLAEVIPLGFAIKITLF